MSVSLKKEAGILPVGRGAGAIHTRDICEALRAVVFIQAPIDGKMMNGSGFLATVEDLESDRVLLVTCKHVIPDVKVAMSKKCTVSIDCVDGKAPGTKISGEDLFDASIFKTDEKKVEQWLWLLDFSIIGVKMDVLRAKLPNRPPKPLPLNAFQKMTDKLQENDKIAVIHYPEPKVQCMNTEHILWIEGPVFGHSVTTKEGSSGSPVIREFEGKLVVVGLHRGAIPMSDDKDKALTNVATLSSHIYDAYMGNPGKAPALPDLMVFGQKVHELLQECAAVANDADHPFLSMKVDDDDDLKYQILFRKYVSSQAAGNGETLLKALGLSAESIAAVYGHIGIKSEIDAVQGGLEKWRGGRHSDPTWAVLLKAMDDAGFAKKHNRKLREKLTGSAESSDDHPALSAKVDENEELNYQMLFRKHVSELATGKGKALLEQLEFDREEITAAYGPVDKEADAVQEGLEEWREGRASAPTWAMLLKAMDDAEIAKEHIDGLKEELMKYAAHK